MMARGHDWKAMTTGNSPVTKSIQDEEIKFLKCKIRPGKDSYAQEVILAIHTSNSQSLNCNKRLFRKVAIKLDFRVLICMKSSY